MMRTDMIDLPIDPPDEGPDTDAKDDAYADDMARAVIAKARRLGGQHAEDLAEEIGSSQAGYALLHDALVQYVLGNEGEALNGLHEALMQAAREWGGA